MWRVPAEGNRVAVIGEPGAVEISCGRCVPCLIVKRDRHVGRMVAESLTSSASVFLTLTYAPPEPLADAEGECCPWPDWSQAINQDHWVLFRKRMRNRHGQAQYCGAAELGDLKGRVHWHVAYFFGEKNRAPSWINLPDEVEREYRNLSRTGGIAEDGTFYCCGVKCKRQYSIKGRKDEFIAWVPEWPHGYVNIQRFGSMSAGYIAKYIMSVENSAKLRGPTSIHNSRQTLMVRSHKLGYEYICDLGVRAIREGLEPTNLYKLPGQVRKNGPRAGQHRQFTMTRGMQRVLGDACLREIARQLATGERTSWKSKGEIGEGFVIADRLEADNARDPRAMAERFFAKLCRETAGQARLPWLELGTISRAVSTPDGGVVLRTTDGLVVLAWPDMSGHGRDIRVPLLNRREVRTALRVGGAEAIGLHRDADAARLAAIAREWGPDAVDQKAKFAMVKVRNWTLEKARDNIAWIRRAGRDARKTFRSIKVFPLVQTLEYDGVGTASADERLAWELGQAAALGAWIDAGCFGPAPKPGSLRREAVRAFATAGQVEALRSRIVEVWVRRWSPPAELLGQRGVRSVGLPEAWAGSGLSSEDRERFPLFAKWFLEAMPNAPPF